MQHWCLYKLFLLAPNPILFGCLCTGDIFGGVKSFMFLSISYQLDLIQEAGGTSLCWVAWSYPGRTSLSWVAWSYLEAGGTSLCRFACQHCDEFSSGAWLWCSDGLNSKDDLYKFSSSSCFSSSFVSASTHSPSVVLRGLCSFHLQRLQLNLKHKAIKGRGSAEGPCGPFCFWLCSKCLY